MTGTHNCALRGNNFETPGVVCVQLVDVFVSGKGLDPSRYIYYLFLGDLAVVCGKV